MISKATAGTKPSASSSMWMRKAKMLFVAEKRKKFSVRFRDFSYFCILI
jgi:hypothetical protein